MIFDQAAFVHLLDQVINGSTLGLAVADRPAQVVVGFIDRGVLAVRLPFDPDGQCLGIAGAAHVENLYDAKRPMKNLINQSEVDVCYAPNRGGRADIPGSPLWAICRHSSS